MTDDTTCPHRPSCDGCPLFELDPRVSYSQKVEEVRTAMARFGLHAWPDPTPAAQGRTLRYRNRARMIVDGSGQLGLYRSGSRDVVPIDTCLVHEPAVEAVLDRVRASGLAGVAHNVDIRANGAGDAIVTFGLDTEPTAEVTAKLAELQTPTISVHTNVGTGAAFLSGEQTVVAGADALNIEVAGRAFEVPPKAFFQVNTEALEHIHELVRPFVGGSEVLWDLYCGVGVHGIACATAKQSVRGFDIDQAGVAAAQRNAKRHGVNATYVAASDAAFKAPDETGHAIVNPARAGLAWTLPALLKGNVSRIAYISCESATFLRDAERLANVGFSLRELHTFDIMPRTSHIELVGMFEAVDTAPRWQLLGHGITGATGSGEQTWVALVHGAPPRRATLPGGAIRLERLRKVDGAAVVRLSAPSGTEPTALLALLKRWRHAVVGDPRGNRASNFRWRQSAYLDVPALHRLSCGETEAPLPDFLLNLFQLPRKLLAERPV